MISRKPHQVIQPNPNTSQELLGVGKPPGACMSQTQRITTVYNSNCIVIVDMLRKKTCETTRRDPWSITRWIDQHLIELYSWYSMEFDCFRFSISIDAHLIFPMQHCGMRRYWAIVLLSYRLVEQLLPSIRVHRHDTTTTSIPPQKGFTTTCVMTLYIKQGCFIIVKLKAFSYIS